MAANSTDRGSKDYKLVYGVRNVEGSSKGYWTLIGVAFQNRDGSLNVKLDFVPTSPDVTIQIRDKKDPEPV